MTLVEFAEKTSPLSLSDCQKQLLAAYEQARNENKQLVVMPVMRTGKRMICKIIDDWNKAGELQEYRCTCGRLLGKFSGRAEVKCPKCGKMNVIGGRVLADSGIAR